MIEKILNVDEILKLDPTNKKLKIFELSSMTIFRVIYIEISSHF